MATTYSGPDATGLTEFERALRAVAVDDYEMAEKSLSTIEKFFKNVALNPVDEKFRKIRYYSFLVLSSFLSF